MKFDMVFDLVTKHENQITDLFFKIRFRTNPQIGLAHNHLKGFQAFGVNAMSVGPVPDKLAFSQLKKASQDVVVFLQINLPS